jgi:hypothetical protein
MQERTVEASRNGVPTTFVLLQGRKKVAAKVTYRRTAGGQYVAVLDPRRKLKARTAYKVVVGKAARDLAGNRLAARSWTFRTR